MRCYLTYMYMYLLRPQTATAASVLSNRYMFRLFVTYWYHSLTKARNICILGHMDRLRLHSAITPQRPSFLTFGTLKFLSV